MGFGLGHHIKIFLKEFSTGVESVVVIEKNPHFFKRALEEYDWTELIENPRICLWVGKSVQDLSDLFYHHLLPVKILTFVRAIDIVPLLACMQDEAGSSYYSQAMQTLQASMERRISLAQGDPEDSLFGFQNLLKTHRFAYESASFDLLKDCMKGIPGLAIGSGPSLDALLPLLKGVNQNAVVACVASTARRLLDLGHHPHFVTAVERGHVAAGILKDLKPAPFTCLVAPPLIDEENYPPFGKNVMTILRQILMFEWLPSPHRLHFFGPSSGSLALYLLAWMGCDPIILVGHDLAFARTTGESHTPGIHDHGSSKEYGDEVKKGENAEWKKTESPGNNGTPILTMKEWMRVKGVYEQFIRQAPNRLWINAIHENEGAFIEGTRRMNPDEVFEKYIQKSSQPVHQVLETHIQKLKEEEIEKWEERFQEILRTTCDEIKKIQSEIESVSLTQPIDALYSRYQSFHQGSSTKSLFYDIIHPLDLDLMAEYHELPRLGLQPAVLEEKQRGLLNRGFNMMREWSLKVGEVLTKQIKEP